MAELRSILELWEKAKQNGQSCVLATVLKTQGSSYRLPGARLLLMQNGEKAGSISGGCLEDELVRKAWWFTENGPMIRRYDTTPDGEIAAEYGLGCNGIIYVLLERVTPDSCRTLDLLEHVNTSREPVSVTHILSPAEHIGTRFNNDVPVLAEETFVETLAPPVRLLLCGAGEDAIPLHRLAHFLGWDICIYDGRTHYARPERFPFARQITLREPDARLEYPSDRWTVGVIMTHSYAQDLSFFTELVGLDLAYLGILGPQKRTLQLLADAGLPAAGAGGDLHAPMGLDIGADGPEQVALSVIAEIQATLNRRDGGQLRKRSGSIHADTPVSTAAYVPSLSCV